MNQQEIEVTSPSPRRVLPWRWLLAAGALALLAGVTWRMIWLGTQSADAAVAVAPKASPPEGTFQATPAQLASFTIAEVATKAFRSERTTEGKIGVNQNKTTPVFSPYSGRVVKVSASPGDRVQRGQALVEMEASEFVQGQNDLITAKTALATAGTQLNQAEITERRKHALYDANAGPLQDWQQSQADLAAAQNGVRSADTALNLVRNRLRILGKTDTEIDALQSATRISSTVAILAPIAGTVIDRQVGLGQFIQTGASTPIYTIGDLSIVWLVANVREVDAPQMRIGEPVEVRVLALPERVFKAKLSYVAPSVDPNTRRLTVRAEIDNADGALKPEMFANFSILTGQGASSPAVPREAVVYEGDAARVWVVGEADRIALRQVRTGRSGDGMVEIVNGLAAGERVVTSGTLFIDRAVKRAAD